MSAAIPTLQQINCCLDSLKDRVAYLERRELGALTVDELPDASTVPVGARATVTDSDSITFFDNTFEGDGVNTVPVFSNGTDWLIG